VRRYPVFATAWLCALISCSLTSAGCALFDASSADTVAARPRAVPSSLTRREPLVAARQDNRAGAVRKPDEAHADRDAISLDLPAFSITADVTGCVHFFSGQVDLLGRTLPINNHRFLCYERIRLNLTCSRDVSRIEYTFLGGLWTITGSPGKTDYTVTLIIPKRPSTLDWSDCRLGPPLQLGVTAWDRSVPAIRATTAIQDIELTGSVYDITYVQPRP
jgi:hypothetical protein